MSVGLVMSELFDMMEETISRECLYVPPHDDGKHKVAYANNK